MKKRRRLIPKKTHKVAHVFVLYSFTISHKHFLFCFVSLNSSLYIYLKSKAKFHFATTPFSLCVSLSKKSLSLSSVLPIHFSLHGHFTSLQSLLSDQNSNHDNDQNLKMKPLCDETKGHEVGRSNSRGKKGSNNSNGKGPKKQPQRGLGVEKLERLRMQESLMKMNETCSGLVPVIPTFTNVPVRYGAPNHVQGVFQCPPKKVLNENSIGLWGKGGAIIGNNRSEGVDGTSSGICGVGFVVPNQLNRVSSYGYGVPLLSPLVGTTLETSKELSSMPNVHFEPQSFHVCLNKKSRFNEINVKEGSHARRDKVTNVPQFAASNVVVETNDFYNNVATHDAVSAYATSNVDESVEIIAIHRNGNSRVFMEYEFLKGKDGIGTTSKGLELATNIDVAEASPIIAVPYGDSASSYIDLSLKLSH